MNAFEMAAFIAVVAIAGGVLKAWLRTRNAGHGGNGAQEHRIATLEERVRALEAVVTDHGYDLRKQFKDLERGT